ncbi:hypothetical protein [Paraburkholderia sediminicola]|uniref:hypothetical protein n=1 Tax=Paraburkholderia sediminicola TaxID=458836 RepID=UPI0038B78B15
MSDLRFTPEEFDRACSLLPEGTMWGDSLNVEIVLHIAQASRRAALEEAAKACDDLEVDRWNLYKGRSPYNGAEDGRANSYVEGESDGAGECAAAIRALVDGGINE